MQYNIKAKVVETVPGTFFGLEIGRRGLQVNQQALNVTGHNLANASTDGYTREVAVITPTDAYTQPDLNSSCTPGQFGTGSYTSMIQRIRDEYMDPQFRNANTGYYYWNSQTDIFNQVQSSFADLSSSTSDTSSVGINDQMTTFFKDWQNLNNNPQDPGSKAAVVEDGVQLANLMSYTYNQLGDIQNSIMQKDASNNVQSGQMKDEVDRINTLLGQVQDYSEDIVKVTQLGQQPNDLLDKRDQLLDELSQYGPLTVTPETVNGKPTGNLTMNFYGVNITTTPRTDKTFSLQIDNSSGTDHVQLYAADPVPAVPVLVKDLTQAAMDGDTHTGGSLLGLESARQSIIGFNGTLNDMANNLSQKIIDKNNTPPPAAVTNFFTGSLSGGDFAVNNSLVSDPSAIDGTKAMAISDISNEDMGSEAMTTTRNYTLGECYGLLLTDVGSQAKGVTDQSASQQAIQEQIQNLRNSVSGVSVDEELTNMVQYQYGYQSSARVINMVDGLLDYLINNMVKY